MVKIPVFLGQSSAQTRHGHEGAARHVNCYSEAVGKEAEQSAVTYCIAGWDTWASGSMTGGVRAILEVGNRVLTVIGRTICSIDNSGAVTIIGGLASDGLVTMAANKRAPTPQVAICCDGIVMMEQGGTVAQITDTDLNAATSVIELDGYMLYLDRRGKLVSSDLNSADVIDGLSFATAEASADDGVRLARRGQEAVVFGTKTTEFWTNIAGDPFPFGRSTVRHFGCAAAGSVADLGETLAFVDHRRQVRLLNGYDAQRISTPPVERALEDEPDISSVRGFAFVERGHEMFALAGTSFTWVYDFNTGVWHERESYGLNRWRASCAVMRNGVAMFGDYALPIVYAASPSLETEDGNPIIMTVQAPPSTAFPDAVTWHRIDIRVIPGTGLAVSGQPNERPELMLDYSHDGGRNWGVQRFLNVGEQGQSLTNVYATRLGRAPRGGRTWRLRMSAAVVRGFVSASAEVERDG